MDQDKLQRSLRVGERPLTPQARNSLKNCEILRNPSGSAIEHGVNVLDLVDSPEVKPETFAGSTVLMKANFGTDYAPEKFSMLFDLIREEGWTEYRFSETVKWFLKHKRWAAWTVADWFDYGVKVFPVEWTFSRNGDFESYELPDGTTVYKPRDGIKLPFPEGTLTCVACQQKFTRSSAHAFNRCTPTSPPQVQSTDQKG